MNNVFSGRQLTETVHKFRRPKENLTMEIAWELRKCFIRMALLLNCSKDSFQTIHQLYIPGGWCRNGGILLSMISLTKIKLCTLRQFQLRWLLEGTRAHSLPSLWSKNHPPGAPG